MPILLAMRILWVFNHPAPYKVDFFNELGKRADLEVLFERGSEADREKGFYSEKPTNFKAVFLNALPLGPHNSYTNGIIPYLKKDYDVIVINGWSTFGEMKSIDYLKKHGKKYVFAINGGLTKNKCLFPLESIKKHYISGADLYLCPDDNSRSYLLHYGAEESRIKLYPYSTVYEREVLSKPISKEERKTFYESKGIKAKNVYVAAGQIIRRKNPLRLISYFSKAGKENALVFLGSGKLENKAKELVKKLHMENVYFPGFKNKQETLKYLGNADASIFLTKEDIYGHVVNESLSQGTPVIASPFSNAARKLISNGVNGYLVNSEKEFLIALGNSLSEQMRENALKTARSQTLEEMAKVHLDILGAIQ